MKNYRRNFWMIPFGIIAMGALTGLVIMSLWNWMMPAIFGLGVITFWQAIGLFILGRLLVGGFNKRHYRGSKYQYAYAYQRCSHRTHQDKFSTGNQDDLTV